MKVLLAGANGQLGHDLIATAPHSVELSACGRDSLDITDSEQLAKRINAFEPQVVINAAAYNAVDQAETEKEAAFNVNADGVTNLANACQQAGARMIHVSTDYVFDGHKNTPYQIDDPTYPASIYGQSKLAGERAVINTPGLSANVIRVSWLYGQNGQNFVHTMLRLMQERDELGVVGDQIGSPTWTYTLAETIWRLCDQPQLSGLWQWSDLGVASWYDFATAIYRIARKFEILDREVIIKPITTAQYPTAAARPAFSAMDSSLLRDALQIPGQHWYDNLQQMLENKKHV